MKRFHKYYNFPGKHVSRIGHQGDTKWGTFYFKKMLLIANKRIN